MGAMPPTLGFGIWLAAQHVMARAARNREKGRRGTVEALLILVLIGVVLWATGHMVLH